MNKEQTNNTNMEETAVMPSGTVLGGRYELGEPVGRGGFSIVYEAADLRTGQKVAIKECTIPTEKERFLREAKILGDYAEEAAIVTVLDLFEDNDTAFIVMEFLEGETLRDHIAGSGRWTMEDTVRSMSPVMKTLENMHRDNVIHRDISPDNIMVMKDGSLRLLDFGSAKQYQDSTMSRLVAKASYSPPEQMDARGIFGSWSDVYSICAAMYFCITGKNPEDAISRLMVDDLKKPSELGADISPDAENILMSGMALDSSKRIRDMAGLRTGLEKIYPVRSDEERAAAVKKKIRRKRRLISASAAALLLLAICGYIFRIPIVMALLKTETCFLDGRELSDEEYENDSETARKRLDKLTHGIYRWDEKDKIITFEVPAGFFKGADPEDITVEELCMDKTMFLGAENSPEEAEQTGEEYAYYEIISQGSDVAGAKQKGDSIILTFTDEAQARLEEYLSNDRNDLCIAFDLGSHHQKTYPASAPGDGKTLVLSESDMDTGRTGKYKLMQFTDKPMEKGFSGAVSKPDKRVSWEDPAKSSDSGSNQKNYNEVINSSTETSCISYSCALPEEDLKENYDGVRAAFKTRLDKLDVPYAIGTDNYDEYDIWVCIPREGISYEEASMLGYTNYMRIGSRYGLEDVNMTSPVVLPEVNDEGTAGAGITCTLSDFADKQESLDTLGKVPDGEDAYLYINDLAIARTDAGQLKKSMADTGKAVFRKEDFSDRVKEGSDEDAVRTMRFLEVLTANDVIGMQYEPSHYYLLDSSGEDIMDGEQPDRMLCCDLIDQDTLDGLKEKYKDLNVRYDVTDMSLCLEYYNEDFRGYDDTAGLKRFRAFIDENGELVNSSKVHKMSFAMWPADGEYYYDDENGQYYSNITACQAMTLAKEYPGGEFVAYLYPKSSADYFAQDSFFAKAMKKQ